MHNIFDLDIVIPHSVFNGHSPMLGEPLVIQDEDIITYKTFLPEVITIWLMFY